MYLCYRYVKVDDLKTYACPVTRSDVEEFTSLNVCISKIKNGKKQAPQIIPQRER